MRDFRLTDFDFALPPELIAQSPLPQRAASRLLQVGREGTVDRQFADLPQLLAPGDLVVFNDTRVIHARIRARKATGGQVEILIERIVDDRRAWVQLRASRAPGVGGVLQLPAAATATVVDRDDRFFQLEFDHVGNLTNWLDAHGEIPLPPYITRAPDAADSERYQTVYARSIGAVAAPTAGLHFDDATLDALRERGINFAFVTLHVGAGTFQPVKSDDLSQHRMHSEYYDLPAATVTAITTARARGARVVAIGTTSLRALESAAAQGHLCAGHGETSLFITPGFQFKVVDRLLTNFHLPRSTLLMLVSAFAGFDRIRDAYAQAIAARYRFFSYGDAMLLDRWLDPILDRAPDEGGPTATVTP